MFAAFQRLDHSDNKPGSSSFGTDSLDRIDLFFHEILELAPIHERVRRYGPSISQGSGI